MLARRRSWPRRPPVVQHREHLADLHVRAFLVRDATQHAGAIGAHLEIDLLGLELDQRLADGDAVALLLQPLRDARLDDRLAELGNDDVRIRIQSIQFSSQFSARSTGSDRFETGTCTGTVRYTCFDSTRSASAARLLLERLFDDRALVDARAMPTDPSDGLELRTRPM